MKFTNNVPAVFHHETTVCLVDRNNPEGITNIKDEEISRKSLPNYCKHPFIDEKSKPTSSWGCGVHKAYYADDVSASQRGITQS